MSTLAFGVVMIHVYHHTLATIVGEANCLNQTVLYEWFRTIELFIKHQDHMFVQWGNDDYDEDEPHDHNGNLGRKRKRTFSASSHIEIQNYSPSVSRYDYVLAR
ncbi:hypothetical protein BLOT_000381 [Blomia tropicalis]|nr:hypothetical protein BLOT_000381 [Blomia tropicalis]